MARSLGQQLDIGGLDIRDIRWMDWVPAGRSTRIIPSDWCSFMRHSLVMPARMMGKLTVEEWRCLIASSLVFEKKIRKTLRGKAFLLTGLPLIVALVAPIGAAILLQMPWLIYLYPVLIIPLAYLGNKKYSKDLKKARLEADTQASIVIGKALFLDVLKKIDNMGLDDIDRLKTGRRGRGPAGLPSITDRIENLQGTSSLASYSTG